MIILLRRITIKIKNTNYYYYYYYYKNNDKNKNGIKIDIFKEREKETNDKPVGHRLQELTPAVEEKEPAGQDWQAGTMEKRERQRETRK